MSKAKYVFSIIIASIILLALLPTLPIDKSLAQSVLHLNWFVYENPSPADERPFSVCTLGKYIYVVGYDAAKINYEYRVEKRLKDNGTLVKVWQYNPTVADDVLFDCLVLNNTLYVIGIEGTIVFPSTTDFGKIVVIALDKDLNMLKYLRMNITGFATSITTDGTYIYVGGFYQKNVDRGWFIAKLTQDLNLVKLALYNPSSSADDYIYQIKFDRTSNTLWIVGLERGMYASIAYVDTNLSFVEPVEVLNGEILGSVLSIDFDEYGNKYVSVYGSMGDKFVGLIKIDRSNRIVATVNKYYGQKVVWAWGALYVIQADSKVSITVFDSNLNQVYSYTLNESTYCSQYLMLGNAAYDENSLYFATGLCQTGDSGWGIYSYKLLFQIRYNTVTNILTLTTTRTLVNTITNTITTVNSYTATTVKTMPPETITITNSSTVTNLVTTTLTKQINFTIIQSGGFETRTATITVASITTSKEVVYQTTTETLPPSTATLTITQWYTYTKTVAPKNQDNNFAPMSIAVSTVVAILGLFIVAKLIERES